MVARLSGGSKRLAVRRKGVGRRKGGGLLRSPAGVEEKIARGVRPATETVLRRISVRGTTFRQAREVTDVEVDGGPGLVESDIGVEGGEAATVTLPRLARREQDRSRKHHYLTRPSLGTTSSSAFRSASSKQQPWHRTQSSGLPTRLSTQRSLDLAGRHKRNTRAQWR